MLYISIVSLLVMVSLRQNPIILSQCLEQSDIVSPQYIQVTPFKHTSLCIHNGAFCTYIYGSYVSSITVKSESNASLHLNTRLSALHYLTRHANCFGASYY